MDPAHPPSYKPYDASKESHTHHYGCSCRENYVRDLEAIAGKALKDLKEISKILREREQEMVNKDAAPPLAPAIRPCNICGQAHG